MRLADIIQPPAPIQVRGGWHGLIPDGAPQNLLFCWAVFSASVSMFVVQVALGGAFPTVSSVLAIGSSVSCGLAWLLSRALFRRDAGRDVWPVGLVAALFTLMLLIDGVGLAGHGGGTAENILLSLVTLIGSSVLLFTLLEAVDGIRRADVASERRFRTAFLAGYGGLLFFGVILFQSEANLAIQAHELQIQSFMALLALIGGSAATLYRLQHPLAPAGQQNNKRRQKAQAACPRMTAQMQSLFERDHIYRDPALRIADLSRRLNAPEYKVSQCVTAGLGYANFNQLLNHYRIADAARRLRADSGAQQSVLEIAFDSGFASIGPFNRAFKKKFGVTPTAYRSGHADQS
ncbi:MAG: AraC family transcriptional regulator [Parvularculaceae bacterium]|nr:AraC family transcriptional regulator [Parvularculaceae bacterium]